MLALQVKSGFPSRASETQPFHDQEDLSGLLSRLSCNRNAKQWHSITPPSRIRVPRTPIPIGDRMAICFARARCAAMRRERKKPQGQNDLVLKALQLREPVCRVPGNTAYIILRCLLSLYVICRDRVLLWACRLRSLRAGVCHHRYDCHPLRRHAAHATSTYPIRGIPIT